MWVRAGGGVFWISIPMRVQKTSGSSLLPERFRCLDCADLHRRDRDAAWPALAAQLRDIVGTADRATLLATSVGAQPSEPGNNGGARAGRTGSGAANRAQRHTGIRCACRLDCGAAMDEASTVFLLTSPVATSVLVARICEG
jgi:hypothetical protein